MLQSPSFLALTNWATVQTVHERQKTAGEVGHPASREWLAPGEGRLFPEPDATANKTPDRAESTTQHDPPDGRNQTSRQLGGRESQNLKNLNDTTSVK